MNLYVQADYRPEKPFKSAEEVWFWCCLCEGVKGYVNNNDGSGLGRPCETTDIFIILKRLVREKKISQQHLHILSKYGLEQAPPHPLFGANLYECRLWKEALEELEKPLRDKHIVE